MPAFSSAYSKAYRGTAVPPGGNTSSPGAFSRQFNPDHFDVDPTRYVTVDPGILLDKADTPLPPKYSPLWKHYAYPRTPIGLLLYKTGQVIQVASFGDTRILEADDAILGGYQWWTESDSWQAQVLAAAGYTLIDTEGLFT